MQNTKDVQKLRAALMDLEKGYKNIQKENTNQKLSAIYFNRFAKVIKSVEDLKQAAKDLRRKHGNEYAYTMNLVINEMALQGYKLQK